MVSLIFPQFYQDITDNITNALLLGIQHNDLI